MLAAIAAALFQPTSGDSIQWWDGIPLGSNAVGFQSFQITRTHLGATRRIRINTWYPAQATGALPLRFGDLWQLAIGEGTGQSLSFAATGDSIGLPPDGERHAIRSPLLSRQNADARHESFPLIVWGSRHGTVAAQAILAEALASHGHVVVMAWSADPPLAMLWEDRATEEKVATITAQTGDILATITDMARRFGADTSRIALLAWSYGGQTAARVQEIVAAVRVVVSLDANVVPARSEEQLRLRVPLLALFQRDTTRRGFENLAGLPAPVLLVRFPDLAHGNFNALEGYLPGLLGAGTVLRWSRGGSEAVLGYRAIARVVIGAVRGFLAPDPGPARATLEALLDQARIEGAEARLTGSSR